MTTKITPSRNQTSVTKNKPTKVTRSAAAANPQKGGKDTLPPKGRPTKR